MIDLAETLFCADSRTSVLLLTAELGKKLNLSQEVIGALSVIDLLLKMNCDLLQQLDFFAKLKISKNELAGFREHKNSLISYGESILNNDLINHSKDGIELSTAFHHREESLRIFAYKMQEESLKQKLTVSIPVIFDSIIHMHCNRFLGNDNKKEIKARLYAHQVLTIINEKMRKK